MFSCFCPDNGLHDLIVGKFMKDELGSRNGIRAMLVGESKAITEVRGLIKYAATSDIPVLITGPSGSGKQAVARMIHLGSRREQERFVAANCSVIPQDLFESALFGHEKGSLTGAFARRRGKFEVAGDGTLFLNAIGDVPLDIQDKILRVLKEKKIEPVGREMRVKTRSRIISATRKNLKLAVDENRFLEDLLLRLSVFPIDIPPLSQRREDVSLLIRHFSKQMDPDGSRIKFAPDAMQKLETYDWPGNAGEVRQIVERAASIFPGIVISGAKIAPLFRRRASTAPSAMVDELSSGYVGRFDLKSYLKEEERRHMLYALHMAEGVVTVAARLVNVRRTTFVEKMKRHKIDRNILL